MEVPILLNNTNNNLVGRNIEERNARQLWHIIFDVFIVLFQ